ncbi:MAG: RHS repeat-associated core domain-containing protein, partial [Actinobacteria bacterium]|nr:RHS repeat-associated core domain-containing protein [Actinomycetota bacterium]
PYGTPRGTTTPYPSDHTYTGQINDPDDLMYYQARYYQPALGRFTQPDTIIPNPGNGQDYNRYMYVRGNPINASDPSGHQDQPLITGGVASGVALNMEEIRNSGFGCLPGDRACDLATNGSGDMGWRLLVAMTTLAVVLTPLDGVIEAVSCVTTGNAWSCVGALTEALGPLDALVSGGRAASKLDDAVGGTRVATNQLDELAEFSGTLRDAARGKSNFGIGSATKADANLIGEAWVGPNPALGNPIRISTSPT